MTHAGWADARLLSHVHKQWGLADAVALDMLAAGCDGIWCSLAEEGAAMGNSCSTVILANLARMGNQKVLNATVGHPPERRQIVYGPRTVEVVFDFAYITNTAVAFDTNGDGQISGTDTFSLPQFLGRLSASPSSRHRHSSCVAFRTPLAVIHSSPSSSPARWSSKLGRT